MNHDLICGLLALGLMIGTPFAAEGIMPSGDMEIEETPVPLAAVETAPAEWEDENEDFLIEQALLEQGYYRDDIPLTYLEQDILQSACIANGIPYSAGIALIEVESNFTRDAVSASGCYGLAQLNPQYFPHDLTPEQNIRAGIDFLGAQLERYGDLSAALQAYHDGYDTGKRWYANRVLATAKRWTEALKE